MTGPDRIFPSQFEKPLALTGASTHAATGADIRHDADQLVLALENLDSDIARVEIAEEM